MPWFYYFARFLIRLTLFLFTSWRVDGKENIPLRGPLLVVSNHLSLADPPIVGVSIDRMAFFMAKEELFRSRFSNYIIRGFGAFPVHRGRLDRKALRQAERILSEGAALVMFPESTRSKNAQLQSAYPGSVLIATRNDVPVLPIGISGTEIIKGWFWPLRHPKITVNIGTSFRLPPTNGRLSRTDLTELTNLMMEHIAELLPVEYRGNYAVKSVPDDNKS